MLYKHLSEELGGALCVVLYGPITVVFEHLTVIKVFILVMLLWEREVIFSPFYRWGIEAQR